MSAACSRLKCNCAAWKGNAIVPNASWAEGNQHLGNRRKMEIGDWIDAIAFLGVGFFLGLALDGLLRLDGTAFWIATISMTIMFWGLIAVSNLFDGLIDRIFPSGIKAAPGTQPKKRKPLAVLLCAPAGIVSGLAGGQFGLAGLLH